MIISKWYDVDKLAHPITAWRRRIRERKVNIRSSLNIADSRRHPRFELGFRKNLSAFYNSLFFFPDRYIGWYPHQVKDGIRLLRNWQPDVIYANGPPFSVFIGARSLARKNRNPLDCGIPRSLDG